MTYRHEIDGLRAIAVMGVILYHVGLKSISAGYAGVDVFFVISGFLIGGIIFRQRKKGSFRYRDFYARRARRILPALFVMILVSMLAGWFTMMPNSLRYFGGAALSTLLFVSNIWFFEVIDYFNPAALRDPLIHTWSLAVEEQFYFVVPLLFGLLWRFGQKGIFWVFAALATISLATAILTNTSQPMAVFYLIHTRAWELFAGVLAALVFPQLNLSDRTAGRLSNLGLLLILGGLGLTPAYVPWPGVWTIIPVTGTALVLLFGQAPSLARSLLTLRPLTIIGLISYSAYLWHQPIISFLDISGYPLRGWLQISAIVPAILAVSWLSWRFIEQPFRSGSNLSKGTVRANLTLAGLAIAAFAIGGHTTKGYPNRMPAEVHDILAFADSQSPTYMKCIAIRKTVADQKMESRCVHGADTEPSIAIWGDSHAALLSQPLGIAVGKHGLALRELTLSSCQPIPNLLNYGQTRAAACEQYNSDVLDYMLKTPSIKIIVLNAIWITYIMNDETTNWLEEPLQSTLFSHPSNSDPWMPDGERKAAISAEIVATITALKASGKTVILLTSLPHPGFSPPKHYGQKIWYGETPASNISFSKEPHSKEMNELNHFFIDIVERSGAVAVNPENLFCPKDECYIMKNGELLFFDENHLSLAGINLVVPKLLKAILIATGSHQNP